LFTTFFLWTSLQFIVPATYTVYIIILFEKNSVKSAKNYCICQNQLGLLGNIYTLLMGRYSHYRYTIDTDVNRYVSIRSSCCINTDDGDSRINNDYSGTKTIRCKAGMIQSLSVHYRSRRQHILIDTVIMLYWYKWWWQPHKQQLFRNQNYSLHTWLSYKKAKDFSILSLILIMLN